MESKKRLRSSDNVVKEVDSGLLMKSKLLKGLIEIIKEMMKKFL